MAMREPDPPASASVTAPNDDPYTAALALDRKGQHQEAAAAFRRLVARQLPNSDLALYHLAQLEQAPLSDAVGAERDYLAYLRDYPQGALAQEAALSVIELQLQRSAFPAALAQMDRFLREHPSSERSNKVHLLRGDVMRSLGRPQLAIGEYALVHGGGTEEDDALYFSASCRGTLGQADAAAEALRGYLQRFPQGRHAAEARAGLPR